MQIAVLANPQLQEEMQQKCSGTDTNFVWANQFTEFTGISGADAYFDLEFLHEEVRTIELKKLLPKPVFINSVVTTLAEIRQPFIRINAWPGFLNRSVGESAVLEENMKKIAERVFAQLNWKVLFVPDCPGMVSARILAMIINEAYYTLQDQVSTKEEIDTAMKLGTNYPFGPFEWSRKIGLSKIYELLYALNKTGTRYGIAGRLKEELGINS